MLSQFEVEAFVLGAVALGVLILVLLRYGPSFFDIYLEMFAFLLTTPLVACLFVSSFFLPERFGVPLGLLAGATVFFVPFVVEIYNNSGRGWHRSRHLPHLSKLFTNEYNVYRPIDDPDKESPPHGVPTARRLENIRKFNYLLDCSEITSPIRNM